MQILLAHRHGNIPLNAAISEELGAAFSGLKRWNLATGYWDLASAWHRLNKQEAEAERCQRELGEAMIRRGQDPEDRARIGCSYSAGWLARGLEVLRRSGADKGRIDTLHKELLEQQAAARGEFHTFERSGMEQFKEARHKAGEWMRSYLAGFSLEEAISRFVAAISPSNAGQIRETILGGSGSSLRFAIGVATLDREGKTAGYVEGQSLADGPTEEQVKAAMFEHARSHDWPFTCDCAIEPGRRIILEEHRLELRDLAYLVQGNVLVAPGHESIYLRGIHAGFHGDFLVASHLLIPQLEQTVRQVIRGHGIVTSTLEGDVQMERDLGWLLTHEKAAEAFGEDLIFDLRGVLIEKFGENLRNNTCHGLIPAEAFYANSGSCYCWWLALRLLWLGIEWNKRQLADEAPT